MIQKATVELVHELQDSRGRPLLHPLTRLVIHGELLPDTPLIHHILAALLDKNNPPEYEVNFENKNNVIGYTLTFTHEDDIVGIGKSEHDLHLEAANRTPPISVEALREEKAAQARQAQAASE